MEVLTLWITARCFFVLTLKVSDLGLLYQDVSG